MGRVAAFLFADWFDGAVDAVEAVGCVFCAFVEGENYRAFGDALEVCAEVCGEIIGRQRAWMEVLVADL